MGHRVLQSMREDPFVYRFSELDKERKNSKEVLRVELQLLVKSLKVLSRSTIGDVRWYVIIEDMGDLQMIEMP